MSLLYIILLSIALAMDCFAVSIAGGALNRKRNLLLILRVALFFGFFQGVMAGIGFLLGFSVKSLVESFDHWVAFFLLSFIGGKMIYEGLSMKKDEKTWDFSKFGVLIFLSIATSIDALAVGISLSFIEVNLALAIIIIGFVSFAFSLAGGLIGEKLGHFFENRIEIAGGIVLTLIGLKILTEHTGVWSKLI